MKKFSKVSFILIALISIYSFTIDSENERLIKITSDKPVTFDMSLNGDEHENLKTPYTFKYDKKQGYFIFKSQEKNKKLNLNVKSKFNSLTGQWNVIVLTVNEDQMSTFGIN